MVLIRAVLFDLDGALVRTEKPRRIARQLAVEKLGGVWNISEEEYAALLGISSIDGTKIICEKCGIGHVEYATYRNMYLYYYYGLIEEDEAIEAYEGVQELFALLSGLGVRIVVVTSTSRAQARAILGITRLLPFVYGIISSDDVENAKPHPEPFRLGLQMALGPNFTQSDLATILAVEDSDVGCMSASAAGILTIVGILHDMNGHQTFDLATAVRHSSCYLNAQFLVKEFESFLTT